MGMIKVFTSEATDFSSNGDAVIQPAKAKVHKENNGDYYLDLEANLDFQSYLVGGNIIVAPTPQGPQAFRLSQVTKTRKKVTARAWHVFYDSKKLVFTGMPVSTTSRVIMMGDILTETWPLCPFTDLDQTDEASISEQTILYHQSLYNYIIKVLELFGGHLVRDNFKLYIKNSIGQDKGITIEYGKNLKELSKVEDWSDVCTDVYAYSCRTGGGSMGTLFQNSSISYNIPYADIIQLDTDLTSTQIGDQAQAYLDTHALPKITYTLKASLDVVSDIGDTVRVRDTELGVDVLTTISSYTYDCLLDRYTEVTFGNFIPTAQGLAKNLNVLAKNQLMGIIGDKQLILQNDKSVTWSSQAP